MPSRVHVFRSMRRLVLGCFGVSLLTSAPVYPALAVEPPAKDAPWQLDALLPEWLSIELNFRARYEVLSEQFRATGSGGSDIVVLRTLVDTRLRVLPWFTVGAEFEDSRAYVTDDAFLDATIVDAVVLLRAYGEVDLPDVLGGRFHAQAGRMTLDVGSRRLVARNRFRNTINGFTGVDLRWSNERGAELRGFWALPVERLPSDPVELQHNEVEFDQESLDVQFWGLVGAAPVPVIGSAELFLFGLHEDDSDRVPTRNRSLYTPGLRIFQNPRRGRFDYQLEIALQGGRSRSSLLANERLDHFAHFEHVEIGYSFDWAWRTRVALQYDYASGDEDPDDARNQRFDTLYGARRFDFGPTGIYGPFARSNINTPGFRIQVDPLENLSALMAVRAFWLASARDVWVTTGVRDPSGDSGKFVGSQLEFRLQWQPLPKNVTLEAGYAHLFSGRFIREAPNSTLEGDSDYVYTQVTLSF